MSEVNWTCVVSEEYERRKQRIKEDRNQKLSTFDWISKNEIWDVERFDLFEISFKSGSRKEFCRNINNLDIITGDWVIINTGNGYDVGRVSLSGDLVRLQMKKRKVSKDKELYTILRPANEWELDKLAEARSMEKEALIKARAITASLNLDMKIGDVEYQGDKRKATFYYTSDGRVDFRELVKVFANKFGVKIEMRQIGIRQESSKIGGIGSCGRELCCSTWHTNFTSVTTEMVRYQNLSVNQSKLTGLCGRLKCCLNYELDTYLEALENFPSKADVLKLQGSIAYLVKLDIFKGIMYYSMKQENDRNKIYALSKERVIEILEMNRKGKKPLEIGAIQFINEDTGDDMDFADVTGQIELPEEKKSKRRRGNSRNNNRSKGNNQRSNNRNNSKNKNNDQKDNNKARKSNSRPNKPKDQNIDKTNTDKNVNKDNPQKKSTTQKRRNTRNKSNSQNKNRPPRNTNNRQGNRGNNNKQNKDNNEKS